MSHKRLTRAGHTQKMVNASGAPLSQASGLGGEVLDYLLERKSNMLVVVKLLIASGRFPDRLQLLSSGSPTHGYNDDVMHPDLSAPDPEDFSQALVPVEVLVREEDDHPVVEGGAFREGSDRLSI